MITCKSCGAEVSPEKAWCPQCNQPLEAEEKRTVAREMDTFDGTLYEAKRPSRPAAPVVPASVPVAPAPPITQVAAEPKVAAAESVEAPRRTWLYVLGGVLIGFILLLLLAFAGALIWYFLA